MSRQEQEKLSSFDPWLREKSEKEKFKEEVRGEVVKELKKRKRRKTLSCCLLGILFLLLILFLSFTAVAKTGLIEIPFFSKFFYKTPEPQRVVKVQQEGAENLEEIFENKIKSQVEEKMVLNQETQKVEVELEFVEEELTAALLRGIATGSLPLSRAQIAVLPKEVEIFGKLSNPEVFLTINFQPKIQNGQIAVKITKFKLGNLSVPVFFLNFFIEKFLKDQMAQINEIVSKGGKLEEIRLEEGRVVIKGVIDVMIFLRQ